MVCVDRRVVLAGGLCLASIGKPALAEAERGALSGARILRDGWTIELEFAGLQPSPGPIEPQRLELRVDPPEKDILAVSMREIGTRTVKGAAVNINPWYDVNHPFPAPRLEGTRLVVPVRLDRPVRAGDTATLRLEPGLVPGASGAALAVQNGSVLRSSRHAQDRFMAGEASTLIAEIDCLTGCRVPDERLVPVTQLPTSFDPRHPRFPNIIYDAKSRRVLVGAGPNDRDIRVLSGVDLRADASGGYSAHANGQRVIIRDCLFDDANYASITAAGHVTEMLKVEFNEMRGQLERTGGDFAPLPQVTQTHHAFFLRHIECRNEIRFNRIHGSTNDGIIIMRGVAAQNAIFSVGWDNRPNPGHADAIWCPAMVPGAAELLVERNFVDNRVPHNFMSVASCLSIALPPTQSHRTIPTGEAFFEGLEARGNFMIPHDISFVLYDGISGPDVPNDRRFIRGHHVHHNWFASSAKLRNITPLLPWSAPNLRWSPDGRWNDNIDPVSGKVWTMGPQPKDMIFTLSVGVPQARAGDVVVYTLGIERYFAQYGPVTIRIADKGGGFAEPLAADIAAAIAGNPALSYANGVLTIRRGLVGGRGQNNAGARIEIKRRLKPEARGEHALRLLENSAGIIADPEVVCRVG